MSEHSNIPQPSPSSVPSSNEVGDRNVERLLAHAYKPEPPSAEFAQQVEARMWFAAQELAKARAEARKPQLTAPRTRWSLAGPLAACAALLLLAFYVGFRSQPPGYYREGPIVWIDGQPYHPNRAAETQPEQPTNWDNAWRPALPTGSEYALHQIGYEGLTARPRPEASGEAPKPATIGETLKTAAGQRRRATLGDGSVLYLNENTEVKVETQRRVALLSGELYVEVAPRDSEAKDGDPTFAVKTLEREFTALGTKFIVRATSSAAQLIVTQGKVRVSGFEDSVLAGQQLKLGKTPSTVEPAARAAHEIEWTRALMAAAESPLVPASVHQGGALLAIDPFGQEVKLSLRTYHVDVFIEDGFARTTIDQTYFNSHNRRMEGTFYFPLPPDASLSRLAMYVGEDLMEGGMAERDHARNVYEQIVTSQKDPALLEWVDGSTFKMRVFPLEACQEKRIVLSYTQRCASRYGRTDYRFPAGHTLGLVREWSLHVLVRNGAPLQWHSSTHTLKEEKPGADLRLTASEKSTRLDRDVAISFYDHDSTSQATGAARFNVAEHEGAKYLMLRYRPSLAGLPKRQHRDWVFLFEADGARDPLLARVQVDVVRKLLQHAEHDDTFAILTAGTRVHAFAKEPQRATPENIKAAVQFLESTHLVGALDLGQALSAAEPFLKAAQNPYLVHLGSATPILGERAEDALLKHIPAATHYVGVGVGKRWNRSFMKNAASRGGGYFTQISPDEQVGWRALELLSALNAPRVLDLKVVDNAERVRFLSFSDSLEQGAEACAIARLEHGAALPDALTITGSFEGKPWQEVLRINPEAGQAGYLPRAWAKLEIDRLLAESADTHKDKIVALSKSMYVMSPFTSLLVLENEAMYTQFNVDRGRKDHWALYPCPSKIKVVFEPAAGQSIDPRSVPQGAEANEKKPSTEQILASILVRIPPHMLRWPNQNYYGGNQVLTAQQLFYGAHGYGWYDHGDWTRSQREHGMREWARNSGLDENERFASAKSVGDKFVSEYIFKRLSADPAFPSSVESLASSKAERDYAKDKISKLESRLGYNLKSELREEKRSFGKVGGKRPSHDMVVVPPDILSRAELSDRFETINPDPPDMQSVFGNPDARMFHSIAGNDDEIEGLSKPSAGHGSRFQSYQRPYFSGDQRVFSDLVAYAPGLNTSMSDIKAVLEAEAVPNARNAPGQIAPEARALIAKARAVGWRKLVVPARAGQAGWSILMDGTGRYAYERTLPEGLPERVICDGTTLWHVYPELGLAARRTVSRFHRAEWAALLPGLLPPAEDLVLGADLMLVEQNTVAIVPKGAGTAKDPEGKPLTYVRLHLIFGADGSLAERRWVEMPSGKTLAAETYAGDTVTLTGADGKVVSARKQVLESAAAPELTPELKDLVVLPLPLRTREFVFQSTKREQNGRYETWSADEALALLAADSTQHVYEAQQVVGQRFFAKGDKRLGFYTLLASGHLQWDPKQDVEVGNNVRVRFDPLGDHPQALLAQYMAQQFEVHRSGYNKDFEPLKGNGFLKDLAEFRNLYWRWNQGRAGQGNSAQRTAEQTKSLEYVRTCKVPAFAWAILGVIQNLDGDQNFYRQMAGAYARFERDPQLNYYAQYERARLFQSAGEHTESRRIFATLFKETLDAGWIPLLDHTFRESFQQDQAAQDQWSALVRDACAKLIKDGHRLAVVCLAWQVQHVGDQPRAEEILSLALASASATATDRRATVLAAVEFLGQSSQFARAEALLEPLLATQDDAAPALWRLAADLAYQRGQQARSLVCLEAAMELEYRALPEVIDVQALREDYGNLLARYQQLADAIATLQAEPPHEFVRKVVRAADRWRALDSTPDQSCQAAARILQALGAKDLAWEYLTTPLAHKPNEAVPWLSFAQTLHGQGDFMLADRAFAHAFEAEATNAQVLWERAQNLMQCGRVEDSCKLYRQIANGDWQPRFQGIKDQARNFLQGR